MIDRRQFLAKAGPILGLPFLWPTMQGWAEKVQVRAKELWIFDEFASSCIDLGHYNQKTRQLTVRFVGRKAEKFYRYSNVGPEIWDTLGKLNESGGVGGYLIENIVKEPKKFPFEEMVIKEFKIVPKRKKAGNSK